MPSARRNPADLLLPVRIAAVASAVPLLMRLPLSRLESVLEPRRRPARRSPAELERLLGQLDRVLGSGGRLARRGCLTRGVTRYWFLRRAGVDVRLVFGAGAVEGAFAAHCWLVREGRPYLERADPRGRFVETFSIPQRPQPASP
jgi:hypothetical protein